jgi:hypothetical protein
MQEHWMHGIIIGTVAFFLADIIMSGLKNWFGLTL